MRCELLTAGVNGLIVLLLPAVVVVLSVLFPDRSDSVTAWRTWVHAKNWRRRGERGWKGVAEGSAVGFLVALLILLPSIIRRPLDAPPFLVVYGGLAAIVGLVIAFVLRLAAVLVLKVCGLPSGSPASPIMADDVSDFR